MDLRYIAAMFQIRIHWIQVQIGTLLNPDPDKEFFKCTVQLEISF
jgi:hypothetical protein